MSNKRLPWIKWHPSDWRADPALRTCGLAARGLWIEMLGVMHEAKPYGHLLVNGSPVTDTQLAGLVGAPSSQIPELLGELERAGVFSRTGRGVIYSRRLTRDEKSRRLAQDNGKKGGNPTLSKTTGKTPPDNPTHKGGHKDSLILRGQRPEAREAAATVAPTSEAPPGSTDGARAAPASMTLEPSPAAALADQVAAILGATDQRWAFTAGVAMQRHLDAGATPALILATARAIRARRDAAQQPPPTDPRYLDGPIRDAMAAAPAADADRKRRIDAIAAGLPAARIEPAPLNLPAPRRRLA